jgi:hypothetical protein
MHELSIALSLIDADLAGAAGFSREEACANIATVRPGLPVLETSARAEAGLAPWLRHLDGVLAPWRQRRGVASEKTPDPFFRAPAQGRR